MRLAERATTTCIVSSVSAPKRCTVAERARSVTDFAADERTISVPDAPTAPSLLVTVPFTPAAPRWPFAVSVTFRDGVDEPERRLRVYDEWRPIRRRRLQVGTERAPRDLPDTQYEVIDERLTATDRRRAMPRQQ